MQGKHRPIKNMLYIVCITGLVLSTAISIPLLVVSIIHARETESKQSSISRSNPFIESLNSFDEVFSQNRFSLPVNQLDTILNSAEPYALTVDMHVSLLKRRRILAKTIPEYRVQYRNAALRSLEYYPYSEILSILAGETLIQQNKLDDNDKNELSNYTKNISMRNPLVLLGFHLMEGSARNLGGAKEISQTAELFTAVVDHIDKSEQPALVTDAAILRIVEGNQNGAINLINKYKSVLLEQADSAWFMAETLYDFDDPAAAASILGIEDYPYVNNQSIMRLADALYRTNNTEDARFFWKLLTIPEDTAQAAQTARQEIAAPEMLEKAFYNLASTSPTDDEKRLYLDKLINLFPENIPGTIMYSRMLNHEDAISLLNKTLQAKKDALIELELIKRTRGFAESGKTTADVWFLLGRYPENPDLYQWASYYFEEMRLFDEAAQLEKNAGYNNIDENFFILQKALNAIRAGKLDEAEQILTSVSPDERVWEISANLGLIKEAQLSFTEALEYYEKASSLCTDNKDKALIQLNIARCFNAAGNPLEAVRVLNYARDLDPDSLRVRFELRKLQGLE